MGQLAETLVVKMDGMINMKHILSFVILLSIVISCNEKLTPEVDSSEIFDQREYDKVTMVIPPLSFDDDEPMTKISLDLVSLKYLWEEKDSVGIFPDLGSQIYFSMAEGVGQSVATFDGGGWALKRSSSYYSYFPFVADYYIDKEAIPISYIGQSQDGNGNLSNASLGNHCFMVAKGVADEATGDLMFTYDRLQMPFMFVIPVEAGTYTSLDVCAGQKVIATSGTINAISLDKVIHNAVYDDHLKIGLKNITFDGPSTLIVTALLPPFDIYGEQFTLNLTKADGGIVTSSVFGKTYTLGKAYKNSPNFSVSPTNVEISGDGGSFNFRVTAAGATSYSISSDANWLTINNAPTSGTTTVTVTASKGTTKERIGHIIISEDVTYKGTTITLQNKIEVTQDVVGMVVRPGDWDESGEDLGGDAE